MKGNEKIEQFFKNIPGGVVPDLQAGHPVAAGISRYTDFNIHGIRRITGAAQIKDCRLRKFHNIPIRLSGCMPHCNLYIVLKHADDEISFRGTLAFDVEMPAAYSEMRIRYDFILYPVGASKKELVASCLHLVPIDHKSCTEGVVDYRAEFVFLSGV